jgi:hypothetical protein
LSATLGGTLLYLPFEGAQRKEKTKAMLE